MPYNILLLPLIGGYWFIHLTYYTRYRAYTLSSYRLVLESATAGALLLLTAQLFVYMYIDLAQRIPELYLIMDSWRRVVPFPYVGTGSIALLLGPSAALLANTKWNADDSSRKAISRYGSDLLQLFQEASVNNASVMVTLNTGKVYVGDVVMSANLRHDNPHVVILPMQSGYRTKDLMTVSFTTDYTKIYRGITEKDKRFAHLSPRDFLLVLPTTSIVSATPFSQTVPTDFSFPPGTEMQPPKGKNRTSEVVKDQGDKKQ